MNALRRVVGVARFNRTTCREILYDPRAIYQALPVLALFFLSGTTAWDLPAVALDRGPSPLPDDAEITPDPLSIGYALFRFLITVALFAAEIAIIMTLGRWMMQANETPGWRGFISLWGIAQAPWIVGGLLWTGLLWAAFVIPLGHGAGMAALALLLATLVWGIAVKVHTVRHAFDSESTRRASVLVVGIWILQSALGYAW